MRIRHHRGFGHGLQPGTDHDMNCLACRAEAGQGAGPAITGADADDQAEAIAIAMAYEEEHTCDP